MTLCIFSKYPTHTAVFPLLWAFEFKGSSVTWERGCRPQVSPCKLVPRAACAECTLVMLSNLIKTKATFLVYLVKTIFKNLIICAFLLLPALTPGLGCPLLQTQPLYLLGIPDPLLPW